LREAPETRHHPSVPFDFSQVVAPFRMQPGLRRVPCGAPQLTPARAGGDHLREKMAVLAGDPGRALVTTAGFDPSPVLAAMAAEAATSDSPAFVRTHTDRFVAPALGWAVRGGQPEGNGDEAIGALLHGLPTALRATALLCLAFEEDFAVIDGEHATLPWLAVCLPSRWAPEDKVGRHFAEVHAPVADNALLVAAGEQLARLVTGGDRWERSVWTISADPRLHQHPAQELNEWPTAGDAHAVAAMASFRHEYQTFVPLAGARQAVFTIRVRSEPLADAIVSRDEASRVHAALSSMSPAVLAYRGLAGVRDRLLHWLAERASLPLVAAP
jgi:hypothetical protein